MDKKYVETLRKVFKTLTLILSLFIGVGAVAGAIMFFVDPYGDKGLSTGLLEPIHDKMPFGDIFFTNLIFAGISLLIVNGITNLISSYFTIKNKRCGYMMGWIFGVVLMAWISIQFYVFAPAVPTIDVVFFLIGLFQAIFGYLAYVYYMQSRFTFNKEDYKNIGKNKDSLVIYFSRMGYTQKAAYQIADVHGSDILELTTGEKTDGILGFWWCGRFGMHKWGMRLNPINKDLSSYKTIYIVSPTWVFHMCGPIREFIKQNNDKLTSVDFTLVHFMNMRVHCAKKEVKKDLGDKLISYNEVISYFGNEKTIKAK